MGFEPSDSILHSYLSDPELACGASQFLRERGGPADRSGRRAAVGVLRLIGQAAGGPSKSASASRSGCGRRSSWVDQPAAPRGGFLGSIFLPKKSFVTDFEIAEPAGSFFGEAGR